MPEGGATGVYQVCSSRPQQWRRVGGGAKDKTTDERAGVFLTGKQRAHIGSEEDGAVCEILDGQRRTTHLESEHGYVGPHSINWAIKWRASRRYGLLLTVATSFKACVMC